MGKKQMPLAEKLVEDLHIDKRNLADAWEIQPQLYKDWAVEYANAAMAREQADSAVKRIYAEMDLSVREDPDAYGISKITEPVVKAAILTSDEYADALQVAADAGREMNMMAAAKDAMRNKLSALENLTKLQISGFYESGTAPTHKSVDTARAAQKRFSDKQSKK